VPTGSSGSRRHASATEDNTADPPKAEHVQVKSKASGVGRLPLFLQTH